MENNSKVLFNNQSEFDDFLAYLEDFKRKLGYHYDASKKPKSYPCIVVLWSGEDSAPYHEFEFVYPEDFQ